MANFVRSVQVFCLFNLIIVSRSETYFDEFSSKLSEQLNDITQAIEHLDERLDKIERVVGITDDHPSNGYDKAFNMEEVPTALIDIRRAKHGFMKAIAAEKHYLRDFVSEYVNKFDKLQKNVTDVLSDMNDTIKESNKNITEEIVKSTNNVSGLLDQMEKETNLLFNNITNHIDTVNITATLERGVIETNMLNVEERVGYIEDKQYVYNIKFNSLESRVSSLNDEQEYRMRRLNSRVYSIENRRINSLSRRITTLEDEQEYRMRRLNSRVYSIETSLDSKISSLSRRISTLEGIKVVFSVFLTSTKSYDKGSIIVFDGSMYTYGGGYSTRTGKFTAPKSGTYLFSLSVEGTSRETAYAHIMSYQNGSKVIRGQARSGEDSFATGSNTIVYYLSKGDQVWVEAGHNGEFNHSRTSFIGVLLY